MRDMLQKQNSIETIPGSYNIYREKSAPGGGGSPTGSGYLKAFLQEFEGVKPFLF